MKEIFLLQDNDHFDLITTMAGFHMNIFHYNLVATLMTIKTDRTVEERVVYGITSTRNVSSLLSGNADTAIPSTIKSQPFQLPLIP